MASVTVYLKPSCPYCVAAKALLDSLGAAYEEIRIDEFPERRDENGALKWQTNSTADIY